MEGECDNRVYDRQDVYDHDMCMTPRLLQLSMFEIIAKIEIGQLRVRKALTVTCCDVSAKLTVTCFAKSENSKVDSYMFCKI